MPCHQQNRRGGARRQIIRHTDCRRYSIEQWELKLEQELPFDDSSEFVLPPSITQRHLSGLPACLPSIHWGQATKKQKVKSTGHVCLLAIYDHNFPPTTVGFRVRLRAPAPPPSHEMKPSHEEEGIWIAPPPQWRLEVFIPQPPTNRIRIRFSLFSHRQKKTFFRRCLWNNKKEWPSSVAIWKQSKTWKFLPSCPLNVIEPRNDVRVTESELSVADVPVLSLSLPEGRGTWNYRNKCLLHRNQVVHLIIFLESHPRTRFMKQFLISHWLINQSFGRLRTTKS